MSNHKGIALGPMQREALATLLRGESIHRFEYGLRGRAKTYSISYTRSFDAFITRLRASGVKVGQELGPRGGGGSSTYHIIKEA